MRLRLYVLGKMNRHSSQQHQNDKENEDEKKEKKRNDEEEDKVDKKPPDRAIYKFLWIPNIASALKKQSKCNEA